MEPVRETYLTGGKRKDSNASEDSDQSGEGLELGDARPAHFRKSFKPRSIPFKIRWQIRLANYFNYNYSPYERGAESRFRSLLNDDEESSGLNKKDTAPPARPSTTPLNVTLVVLGLVAGIGVAVLVNYVFPATGPAFAALLGFTSTPLAAFIVPLVVIAVVSAFYVMLILAFLERSITSPSPYNQGFMMSLVAISAVLAGAGLGVFIAATVPAVFNILPAFGLTGVAATAVPLAIAGAATLIATLIVVYGLYRLSGMRASQANGVEAKAQAERSRLGKMERELAQQITDAEGYCFSTPVTSSDGSRIDPPDYAQAAAVFATLLQNLPRGNKPIADALQLRLNLARACKGQTPEAVRQLALKALTEGLKNYNPVQDVSMRLALVFFLKLAKENDPLLEERLRAGDERTFNHEPLLDERLSADDQRTPNRLEFSKAQREGLYGELGIYLEGRHYYDEPLTKEAMLAAKKPALEILAALASPLLNYAQVGEIKSEYGSIKLEATGSSGPVVNADPQVGLGGVFRSDASRSQAPLPGLAESGESSADMKRQEQQAVPSDVLSAQQPVFYQKKYSYPDYKLSLRAFGILLNGQYKDNPEIQWQRDLVAICAEEEPRYGVPDYDTHHYQQQQENQGQCHRLLNKLAEGIDAGYDPSALQFALTLAKQHEQRQFTTERYIESEQKNLRIDTDVGRDYNHLAAFIQQGDKANAIHILQQLNLSAERIQLEKAQGFCFATVEGNYTDRPNYDKAVRILTALQASKAYTDPVSAPNEEFKTEDFASVSESSSDPVRPAKAAFATMVDLYLSIAHACKSITQGPPLRGDRRGMTVAVREDPSIALSQIALDELAIQLKAYNPAADVEGLHQAALGFLLRLALENDNRVPKDAPIKHELRLREEKPKLVKAREAEEKRCSDLYTALFACIKGNDQNNQVLQRGDIKSVRDKAQATRITEIAQAQEILVKLTPKPASSLLARLGGGEERRVEGDNVRELQAMDEDSFTDPVHQQREGGRGPGRQAEPGDRSRSPSPTPSEKSEDD